MLKQLGTWLKSFPYPPLQLGIPRVGAMPSTWGIRAWNDALRSGMAGYDVSTASLMRASATIACCNLLSDTLASAPLSIRQRDPVKGVTEVQLSPASDLLLSLTYDDLSSMLFGATLLGNGFLYNDGRSLSALDSFRTTVFIGPDNRIWLKQATGDYIAHEQVAHVRFRYQSGYVLGYNPALLAQDSLKAALGLIGMAGALSVNAATPSQVIEVPNALSDKAIKNIKTGWAEAHSGDKQGGVAVLEEGAKLNQLEAPSATDAQMIEALEWSSADICRLYGIGPSMVGLLKDANKATSSEETVGFYQRAVRPWAARVTDALGRQLLSPTERRKGLVVSFDLSHLQIGFGKPAAEFWAQLVNSGIASTDDARDALDLPDVPQGSRVRVPANMVFLDRLDSIPTGDANGQRTAT